MATTSSGRQVFERAVQFQFDEGSWSGVDTMEPREAAVELRREYWEPLRCGEMPPMWAMAAFDMAVNHQDIGATARTLQEALAVGMSIDGTVVDPLLMELAKKRDPLHLGRFHSIRAQMVLVSCEAGERVEKVRRVMECYALCRGM